MKLLHMYIFNIIIKFNSFDFHNYVEILHYIHILLIIKNLIL